VTEQFLNCSQVSSSLEQVCGSRMAESVWADIRRALHRTDTKMHRPPHRSLINPAAAGAKQQGGTAVGATQLNPAEPQITIESPLRRYAIGHDSFLGPLAEDPDHAAFPVHVVDVHGAELADADPRGIQQLDDEAVA
jgi:hypothetical protein